MEDSVHKETAKKEARDKSGRFTKPLPPFISSTETKDPLPPLVSLKVTNPITYLKLWWKKVLGNEGIELKLKIRPLTAIALVIIILGTGFSIGWWTAVLSRIPIIKGVIPAPTSTPNPWRETAFAGTLKYTDQSRRYYLVTQDSEAVTLEVPENVNLSKFVGKRILARGSYNAQTKVLIVEEASDMEILPTQVISLPSPMPI